MWRGMTHNLALLVLATLPAGCAQTDDRPVYSRSMYAINYDSTHTRQGPSKRSLFGQAPPPAKPASKAASKASPWWWPWGDAQPQAAAKPAPAKAPAKPAAPNVPPVTPPAAPGMPQAPPPGKTP